MLDACVLYPAPLRDLFMHLAVLGAFEARWTADIHAEWMENVLANRPDLSRSRLERTRALMDENAEGALVTGYTALIPGLFLPDPNDRHVLAAAIESGAELIVTWNVRDFPADTLAPYEIATQIPDTFLGALYDRNAEIVIQAAQNQRAQLRNPPRTVAEYLGTLSANKLPHFVARLGLHADRL